MTNNENRTTDFDNQTNKMFNILKNIKGELSELASVLNLFKSEAVQLRIVDYILENEPTIGNSDAGSQKPARISRPSKRTNKSKDTNNDLGGKSRRASSGTGGPATLAQLLEGDFFKKKQTINDILDHCKHNLARTIKANEISGKLARMVRNGELKRAKNADHQYEYQKP